MNRLFFILAMLVPALAARASDWGDIWDSLAQQPGATVTDGQGKAGEPTRQIALPSKVVFYLRKNGDKVEVTGVDKSGHGAVACAAHTFPVLLLVLDTCAAGRYPALHQALTQSVDQIDDFTVRNGIVPRTKEQLRQERLEAAKMLLEQQKMLSPDDVARKCREGDFNTWLSKIEGADEDEAERIRKVTGELLSEPRPPVLNPCF